MKLADLKTEFEKYIVVVDPWAMDLVMGTMVGNFLIERDPIWTMIVAPSSGGKTTFIAPCAGIQSVLFIDDLTEKTLVSGYKVKGKEVSLLRLIGSGIMCFSDFTGILSKNPNSRGEILGQLKMVYDGKFTKYTGTGHTAWEGKIGFVGACTPDIYYHLESGRSMGERFLYYWLEQPSDTAIADKQEEVKMSSKEITETMKPFYADYLKGAREHVEKHGIAPLSLTRAQRDRIRQAAIFCVNGKATVHTNFKTGKADQIPNKAGVGRDNKVFDSLLHALQIMDAMEAGIPDQPVQDDRISMIEKCAYSSINRERRKILEILCSTHAELTGAEIGAMEGLGLEKESVDQYLVPLAAVGMIRKRAGHKAKWWIDDEDTRSFVNRVSRTLVDNTPSAKPVLDADKEENNLSDEDEAARLEGLSGFNEAP